MTPYCTKANLAPQDTDSRFRNIEQELRNQLDMQFDVEDLLLTDDLEGLSLDSERFARILSAQFPFLSFTTATNFLARSRSVSDLIYLILEQVGPCHDHAAKSHDASSHAGPSLFAAAAPPDAQAAPAGLPD